MNETELFLIKYQIADKVSHLFGAASEELRHVIAQYHLPEELAAKRARIFRGENYLRLPYVVMDYPALFGKEVSFAYRTMFWWGNFFSFTLQLSGMYLEKYQEHIFSNLHKLKGREFYFCIHTNPWQYHYNPDNYILIDDLLKEGENIFKKQISENEFVKLSCHIKISGWNDVSKKCAETFQQLMDVTGLEKKML